MEKSEFPTVPVLVADTGIWTKSTGVTPFLMIYQLHFFSFFCVRKVESSQNKTESECENCSADLVDS